MSGSASSTSSPANTGRLRAARRTMSTTFTVTRCSQVVNLAWPRNSPRLRWTWRKTSWITSSESAVGPSIRNTRRPTSLRWRRNSSVNAARSPRCARLTSSSTSWASVTPTSLPTRAGVFESGVAPPASAGVCSPAESPSSGGKGGRRERRRDAVPGGSTADRARASIESTNAYVAWPTRVVHRRVRKTTCASSRTLDAPCCTEVVPAHVFARGSAHAVHRRRPLRRPRHRRPPRPLRSQAERNRSPATRKLTEPTTSPVVEGGVPQKDQGVWGGPSDPPIATAGSLGPPIGTTRRRRPSSSGAASARRWPRARSSRASWSRARGSARGGSGSSAGR